jgi:hypothetical protein
MADRRRKVSYRVKVTRIEKTLDQWQWEILRDDKPLAARLREGPFNAERIAIAAGTAALREFLKLLKQARDDG